MKLGNFASFDPSLTGRGVRGLANASRQDKEIWQEFNATPSSLAEESEEATLRLVNAGERPFEEEFEAPAGPTEVQLTRPMRLVQRFFQRAVLISYHFTCAFCSLNIWELLNASHIIPWKDSEGLRADPRNGICLCCLHDRAFDRGLMSVDANYRLLLSARLKETSKAPIHKPAFMDLEGRRINLPDKFAPHLSSLEHHRTSIFKG